MIAISKIKFKYMTGIAKEQFIRIYSSHFNCLCCIDNIIGHSRSGKIYFDFEGFFYRRNGLDIIYK